jgi:hypothetical protein
MQVAVSGNNICLELNGKDRLLEGALMFLTSQ